MSSGGGVIDGGIGVPDRDSFVAQIAANLLATLAATLVLRFSGLLSRDTVTLSQLGVVAVVLFTAVTASTAATSLRRDDAKYVLTMGLIVTVVALVQWTYSFSDLSGEPVSMAATQLPVVVMIWVFGRIVVDWGD